MAEGGDFAIVVRSLLEYLRGKGQVYAATDLASIVYLNEILRERYGLSFKLDKFVEAWVAFSEIEAARWETVAQRNIEKIAAIQAKVNYVEEQGSRTRVLPLGGRRKKE